MEWPNQPMPVSPVMTPWSRESLGEALAGSSSPLSLFGAVSFAWPTANKAFFYPFRLTYWATAYQLLFWVGATSSGNIDVGIYDSQKNKVVSSGSTAMSVTANTVQELNITDTVLPPGDYLLGVGCDNTTGTCFEATGNDEIILPEVPVYEQAGLTGPTLPDPIAPVLSTEAAPRIFGVGIQFRSIF